MTTETESVVLLREDGVQHLSPGGSISTYDGDITGGYLPGECPECGRVTLMYGDFNQVAVDRDQPMGPEILYSVRHYAYCGSCDRDLFIESEFSEYPKSRLRFIQIRELDAEYSEVDNLMAFATDIQNKITTIEDVFGSMRELEQVLDQIGGSLPPVLSAMKELRQSQSPSALVLGDYDEIDDLRGIKGDIGTMGYDAYLVEDIKERLEDDPDQAVKLLMHMCSFSVMVDKNPSGHISEIEYATNNRHILAILIPDNRGRPSTAMVTRPIEDAPYAKIFEYSSEPSERLEDIFRWAEEKLEEKKEKNDRFPWK